MKPPTRPAHLRVVEVQIVVEVNLFVGDGTPRERLQSELAPQRASRVGCLSFLRRQLRHGALRPQEGSIKGTATPEIWGPDRSAATQLVVSEPFHVAPSIALERMVPSRRP